MSQFADRLHAMLAPAEEETRQLPLEARHEITEFWSEATEEEVAEGLEVVAAILQERPGSLRVQYARALGEELADNPETAGNILLQIAQLLAGYKDWEAVLELAVRAMPLNGDYRLLRLVCQAGEQGLEVGAALELAASECGDSPDLLWERSQQADAGGDEATALQLALQAIEGYVAIKEPARAEDPLLRVLEATDPPVYRDLLRTLRRLSRAGLTDLLATAFELATETLFALDLWEELAETLEQILEQHPQLTEFRALWAQAITHPDAANENLADLIAESGLADPALPPADALAAFHDLAAYSPGAHVWHRTWGVGLIRRNEEGELLVDFEHKSGHHMALEMAKKILNPLAKDSLQVRRATDLEELRQEADTDPAAIISQLLSEGTGEIVTADIKLRLTDWLIPEEKWSAWWRKARKAIEEDSRIDCSQAFQQRYRLAENNPDLGVPLPDVDPRKGVKGAVSLILKLLSQHPDLENRASNYYGPELLQLLARSTKPDDWIRALPFLMRWYPQRKSEWETHLERVAPNAEVTLGASAEDQAALLELGLQTRSWQEAAFSGLASRFAPVKERALQALQERSGEALWQHLEDLLLLPRHNAAKMALADLVLRAELKREGVRESEPVINPWHLLVAALSVLTATRGTAGRGTANRLLKPDSQLAAWLIGRELTEEDTMAFNPFRRKRLEGELDLHVAALLEKAGHEALAGEICRSRARREGDTDRLPEMDPRLTLMTRKTFYDQSERLREMERLLADDIPDEIAKARALGDLSENAEYHAARERQGITKALFDSLSVQMETAAILEDFPRLPGVARAGTEVRLEVLSTGVEQIVWLLGEGDSQFGHGVVSYKAPLGQALVGKMEGDIVEMNGTPHFKILSVVEKLPE